MTLVVITLSQAQGQVQVISNGTFNGDLGTNVPPDWQSCLTTSTVDVQPGSFGVNNTPQDGTTYLGMACRSPTTENPNTCEEVGQFMTEPLVPGRCYLLEVYLAFAPSLNVPEFRNPMDFKAFLGADECEGDLEIAHFTNIDHTDWRKYQTSFTVSEERSYVWIQGDWSQLPQYSAYMLVDNFSIRDLMETTLHEREICIGSTISLESTYENVDSYLWSNGETGSTITIDQVGRYTLDIIVEGCPTREIFDVVRMPDPDPVSLLLCPGEVATLRPSVSNAVTYQWNTGATTATIDISAIGEYFVDIVQADGCRTRETFNVGEDANPDPVNIEVCAGESVVIASAFGSASSFLWSDGSRTRSIRVVNPGQYTVQSQSGTCVKTEVFNLTNRPNPVVNIVSENEICPEEQILLDAFQPNATYFWQDGSTESSFVVEAPGRYWVEVTVDNCTTQQRVEIFRGECRSILVMPNAFTPNGDGKNDTFIPIESVRVATMLTKIYNRWGKEIYSTENLNVEWDGNFPNGDPAPESTYYWSIWYAAVGEEIQMQKGTVSLIR